MEYSEFSTSWVRRLKAGEDLAAQKLWEQYFAQLVHFAQRKLRGQRVAAVDEEDIALSALNSFCARAAQGKFPRLDDRQDLWRLLVTITARKVVRQVQYTRRLKRGGGAVRGESAFLNLAFDSVEAGIEQVVGSEPTPAFAAEVAEQFQALLARLGDDSLRRLAMLKLEGYSNEEIAGLLDCGLRTVERRLGLVRAVWSEEEEA